MIGKEEIERYRKMTIEEKLREFDNLMDAAFEFLMTLPPEELKRRLEIWERQDEEGAEALDRGLKNLRP